MTTAVEPSPRRPALLRVGMVLSFGGGVLAVVLALLVVSGSGDLSRLRDTPWRSWVVPILLGFGAMLLAIGFGIRDRRRWARPLILAFWLLEGALNVIALIRSGQARWLWVPFVLLSGWYLYKKKNVVGYFARSRATEEGR